jgi:uncharacterized membrane protein
METFSCLFRLMVMGAFMAAALATEAAPLYNIRALGRPPSSPDPGGLNDMGHVALSFTFPIAIGADVQTPDKLLLFNGSKTHELPTLGGEYAAFLDINDDGTMVGIASSPDTYTTRFGEIEPKHAVQYRDGKLTKIDTPVTTWSVADTINERGQIVGTFRTDTGQRAFLWGR